jgi:hypothetical protein
MEYSSYPVGRHRLAKGFSGRTHEVGSDGHGLNRDRSCRFSAGFQQCHGLRNTFCGTTGQILMMRSSSGDNIQTVVTVSSF